MQGNGRLWAAAGFLVISMVMGINYYSSDKTVANLDKSVGEQIAVSDSTARNKDDGLKNNVGTSEVIGDDSKVEQDQDIVSLLDDTVFDLLDIPTLNDSPANLALVYDELVNKALGGDVDAARNLALELWDCQYAHSDRAALKASIERVEQEKIVSHPDPELDIPLEYDISLEGVDMISDQVSMLTSTYERCLDVDAQKRSLPEIAKWAEMAAEQGDFLAIKHLQMRARFDPPEALKWANEAWEKLGDVAALSDMALLYARGLNKLSEVERVPNFQKAYAYNFAYKAIKEASSEQFYAERNSTIGIKTLEALDRRSAFYASQLGLQETLEAEALALEIIKNNKNCCSSMAW